MSNAEETVETPRIAVILAGGVGRRMGGADKGGIMLGGRRLVDHVLARLSRQAGRILISGPHDYGSGLTAISDRDDGPCGPAAGLWSALHWIRQRFPDAKGFLTAPVDGPFLPADLFDRLSAHGVCAVACDGEGVHPTFACWRLDALRAALEGTPKDSGLALKALADSVHAERVLFEDAGAFLNINTPDDLKRAEKLLAG